MLSFYVCRHGQTVFNKLERLQGQIDTPLTEEGQNTAKALGEKLQNVHFDLVYVSDMGRAIQTAFWICKRLNILDHIQLEPALREVDFGEVSGMATAEAIKKYPGIMSDTNFIPPQGESLAQMQHRTVTWLLSLPSQEDKNVLLVTHNTLINALKSYVDRIDFGTHNINRTNPHDFIWQLSSEDGRLTDFHLLTNSMW